jgi:hypothetical protein
LVGGDPDVVLAGAFIVELGSGAAFAVDAGSAVLVSGSVSGGGGPVAVRVWWSGFGG